MKRTRAEYVELTREFLRQFETLESRATDDVGWIALKLSCSRTRAERLIAAARAANHTDH